MTAVNLSSLAGAGAQFFDDNGVPLSGGKLYTYAAGTTTPAVTYTSSAGVTANANPIVLDAAGRAASEIWLVSNARYKFILKTAADVQIWSFDNIPGILEISSITAADVAFTGFNAQDGTVEDLAGDDGADWIGYTPSGIGAVAQSVQEKLQKVLINRDDYDTIVNFDAAVTANPTIPSLDDDGNFAAKLTPAGEGTQLDLNAATRPTAGMNRGRVNYYSADAVEVIVPEDIVMGGFRFMGQYKKGRAPVFASNVPFRAVVSMVTDLGAETTRTFKNWYAVFACANDGDVNATYKLMPFVRVGSVAGSVCTLNYAGENSHTVTPITYTWPINSLVGVDCLVINEGTDNRFSGRTTTITANTGTTVTLADIGSVGAYDYLLIAPPDFDQYCYLCSYYCDVSGEPYNIADSGCTVESYMSANQDPNWVASGAVSGPPGNKIMWGGYIPPLAGGVLMRSALSTSTSGGGDIYTNFAHDSGNHVVGVHTYYKDAVAGTSTQMVFLNINFSTGQFMYYWVEGPLVAQRILGQIRAQGWIEP